MSSLATVGLLAVPRRRSRRCPSGTSPLYDRADALPTGVRTHTDAENSDIRQSTQQYEMHPNVTADSEPTLTTCTPCNTKLTVQASQGDAPDIVIENDTELPRLPPGVIQPLNPSLR